MRILLAEDVEDTRESCAELLRMHGHEVCTAATGEQALESVEREAPDAALIDIGLPDMTGHELAARIRQLVPAAVLIAVTGWHPASAEETRGFDHYLLKPVAVEALLAKLPQRNFAAALAAEAAIARPTTCHALGILDEWRTANRQAMALETALATASMQACQGAAAVPPSAQEVARARRLREAAKDLFELAMAELHVLSAAAGAGDRLPPVAWRRPAERERGAAGRPLAIGGRPGANRPS